MWVTGLPLPVQLVKKSSLQLAKRGRVEEWKSGKVDEWKSGKVEVWMSGRVEECKGHYSCTLPLFHQHPKRIVWFM